jgi:Cd2+/Zn2+-exporting ATPase
MIELRVEGLNCGTCAAKIQNQINNLEEVQEARINLSLEKLVIIPLDPDNHDAIKKAVTKIVKEIEPHVKVSAYHQISQEATNQKTPTNLFAITLKMISHHIQTIIGAILFFATIAIKTSIGQENGFIALLFIMAYLLIGGDIIIRAIKNLLKGQLFDENFLMTLATIGAFALGEYVEAVAVMLFYRIGEAFQDYAVDHSRRSIKSLLDIKADFANLIIDDITKEVTPEDLKIDDTILLRPGEKVPVDCVIITGSSSVNTSALTGESLPRSVSPNDQLLSGSINNEAPLTAKVTNTFKDSTVAKILNMVENATEKKAKTEQFITKFARIYTPIVVIAATILATLPPLLGLGDFREWLSRALIFLVISCPCALVLSVPLGFFGGLGAASKNGILIKGGNYLEALNSIDTFVFDKTGTLTKGNFVVQKILGTKTLDLAANIEIHSTHPIAKSILAAYGQQVSIHAVDDVLEIKGQGLTGIYEGQSLYVGNERLMASHHITFTPSSFVGTVVYVAYGATYIGCIEIADEIKTDATNLSAQLKSLGAKDVIMLTGDQRHIAQDIANRLHIEQVFGELMPEDKLSHVESLIAKGRKVLFVGDGINDSPVLARAHIGVAMGGIGSDAAIESADIILMTDEPSKLLKAQKIAKKTRKIVMENILFALTVKLIFLSLGAIGIATMYEAIFADVGVALLAILNSMRSLKG